ncbi:unnamed protein product [Hyaloperonospora brassicae]|uniref:tRNA-intron lyase n=1 Tax=Hyaloperonospora brassicae TaxID=162125 RepID=A0AAV0T344_HYABA|nr:unnamed protein product [Hyaloperonospora brassicae]
MVAWKMLPGGRDVEVTLDGTDAAWWTDMQQNGFGVAPVTFETSGDGPQGPRATGSMGALENATKRRRLTLPEFYYIMAMDAVLSAGEHVLQDVWQRFERSSATFTQMFVTYQHFRRRGWTPRPGLNYGAHYVLYRGSAAAFHSEYVVYVQRDGEALSWNSMQSLTRIAADVKKTVLLCTVTSDKASADAVMPQSSSSLVDPPSAASDACLTSGTYSFHGIQYTFEAVAIRFWDAATAGERQSYTFEPQPVLQKGVKSAKRKGCIKHPKR